MKWRDFSRPQSSGFLSIWAGFKSSPALGRVVQRLVFEGAGVAGAGRGSRTKERLVGTGRLPDWVTHKKNLVLSKDNTGLAAYRCSGVE